MRRAFGRSVLSRNKTGKKQTGEINQALEAVKYASESIFVLSDFAILLVLSQLRSHSNAESSLTYGTEALIAKGNSLAPHVVV